MNTNANKQVQLKLSTVPIDLVHCIKLQYQSKKGTKYRRFLKTRPFNGYFDKIFGLCKVISMLLYFLPLDQTRK